MKITKYTRFDDTDLDCGYQYRGYNYVIQNEEEMFLIRTYDSELGQATVVSPAAMSKNGNLKELVEFLQSELGISKIYLYKGSLGTYAEIDLDSLAFCSA